MQVTWWVAGASKLFSRAERLHVELRRQCKPAMQRLSRSLEKQDRQQNIVNNNDVFEFDAFHVAMTEAIH